MMSHPSALADPTPADLTETPSTSADDRLNGPVHTWFGLSCRDHLVVNRALLQSMPGTWQERFVACLRELDDAYTHVDRPSAYLVTAADEGYVGELSTAELRRAEITRERVDDDDPAERYLDRDGVELDPYDWVLIPLHHDPLPHYDGGRTFVPPLERQAAVAA